MGGSGALNFMLYVRGNQEDYNNWEKIGNPGWSYKEVLPYFRKSEDNRNPDVSEFECIIYLLLLFTADNNNALRKEFRVNQQTI